MRLKEEILMIDLRNTCVLVRTPEENEMLLKEAEKQEFHWYGKDNCEPLQTQYFPDILKFYEYDITYAASVRSDFAFYEASELLETKEMTVRDLSSGLQMFVDALKMAAEKLKEVK